MRLCTIELTDILNFPWHFLFYILGIEATVLVVFFILDFWQLEFFKMTFSPLNRVFITNLTYFL